MTLALKDTRGNPLEGVEVSPAGRTIDKSTAFLSYFMHLKDFSKRSDRKGEVTFTAWKPGESGSIHYRNQQRSGELEFTVAKDRRVTITLPDE